MKLLNLTRMMKYYQPLARAFCQLEGEIQLEKTKPYKIKRLEYNDKLFSQAMLNVKSRKARSKSGLILLEGKRLIQDAIKMGIQPEMIFYSQKDDLDKLTHLDREVKLYKMPYKDMKVWSDLTTSPGIVAFCRKPEPINIDDQCLPVTVVCDQVREPGNLGAIIRCAAGAGIQKVVLTKGCVDVWDSKVLRGAAGAHFHLPIFNDVAWDDIVNLINADTKLLLAVHQPSLVNNTSLPCTPYYKVEYNQSDNIVIVVGGETEGLSETVFQIAHQFSGKAINIPLSNNVESLNCVSAMSIILFEIKRQLTL